MMKSALHKPWIDMQLPIRKLNTYLLFFLYEYPFRYYYRFITNSHFEHVVKNLSYHYRSINSALLEIENGTFHFASKEELNDPLEGFVRVFWLSEYRVPVHALRYIYNV